MPSRLRREPRFDPASTTSIGSPSDGRLVGGIALPLQGRGFVADKDKNPARRYGTAELVGVLIRSAGHVHEMLPGGTLTVGDLSLPDGGEVTGHATHQLGRDVDVLFYLVDANGQPIASKAIPIEPDGTGTDYKDLSDGADDVPVRLDRARTWSFVEAVLSDPEGRVNRIYVVEHVRSLLIEHAEQVGAPQRIVALFGDVTCQPRFPHDDHMHIRLFCSVDDIDAGCEDTLPIYPWHLQHLSEHGRTFVPARPRSGRAKVTSVEQAARAASRKYGPFHPEVRAFLARRRAWVDKPHPGRAYCP